MPESSISPDTRLRVLCLEDNPLIVFHLEQLIEDLGHEFAGSFESFADLKADASLDRIDCALVDIDLADGPTGPAAARWLSSKGIPCIFVTGQEQVAARHPDVAVDTVVKPITPAALAAALTLLANAKRPSSD